MLKYTDFFEIFLMGQALKKVGKNDINIRIEDLFY